MDLNPRPSDYKSNSGASRGVPALFLLSLSAETLHRVLRSTGTNIGTLCRRLSSLHYYSTPQFQHRVQTLIP